MSASSNTPSPGRTPNGLVPPSSFRRKQANPLVSRKKPGAPRPAPRTSTPSSVNGLPGKFGANKGQPSSLQSSTNQAKPSSAEDLSQEEYEDIPVFTSKRAALQGVRHHVMRLLPNNSFETRAIDPTDEAQFVRPVRLHRRDPRANSTMLWRDNSAASSDGESKNNAVDEKERERLEAAKAEKQAEREANQAQIAPTAKKAAENKAKKNKMQKKTELVYKFSDSVTKEKNQRIRYEESLPWHLEDFDNKNIWVGSYEAALSECHVLLTHDSASNSFQMVPVEKWYKFAPKSHIKTMSIEEAEKRMGQGASNPHWLAKNEQQVQMEEKRRKFGDRLFTRSGERGERRRQGADEDDEEKPEEVADADDIDYDYEEAFADDEENALFEGDKEESKQAEEKLTRERREANVFELKEEKDYDEEEEEKKKKEEEKKKLAKKIEKALMKRERNFVYEDDSDGNPYASESDSQDSDEQEGAEEGVAKDQEGGDASEKAKNATTEAGTSSKGTNTPSGRNKTDDQQKGLLKRPGSPNLSDASGNESSRKKVKKSHGNTPQPTNPASSGASISRPSSPANQAANGDGRKNSVIKLNMRGGHNAGSGSDGEMSDAGQSRKNKTLGKSAANSRVASPNGSRAGSPAAGAAPADSQSSTKPPQAEAPAALPTAEDVRSKIPPEGIELTALRKIYGASVLRNPAFIPLLKAQARWAKNEKKFYPKGT